MMQVDPQARARRFWDADPHRWANAEAIPPDDRTPREQLAARLARHAEAQDAGLWSASYRRTWQHTRWTEGRLPACRECKSTHSNGVPGYGQGFRSHDGLCARCLARQLGEA
jgi:hypothetical protein